VSSPVDPPQACGVVGKSASTGDGATSSWRNDGSEMVGVSFAEGNEAPRRKRLYLTARGSHGQGWLGLYWGARREQAPGRRCDSELAII
jgi:hypothetical protein